MPNIHLRLADDLLLSTPAHSFRLVETAEPGSIEAFPEARSFLLYDQGGREGVQFAYLKTSMETVLEMVRSDPMALSRIVEIETVGGQRVGLLPQHYVGISGVKPPAVEEIAEMERAIETAAATPMLASERETRLEQMRQALDAKRSFLGVRSRLDLHIPDANPANPPRRYTYWLAMDADELQELIEPTPVRPAVQATPVREKLPRRGGKTSR